jgi:integrase
MPLTDTRLRALKAGDTPYKRADSLGLYVLVPSNGAKLWRLDYAFAGKRKTMALGAYPVVSLHEARESRDAAKKLLRQGLDPGAVAKQKKAVERQAITTFEVVATDWLEKKMVKEKKSKSTLDRARWLLGILNDGIGDRPIGEIEAPELLEVLRKVEAQNKHEAVKRLRSTASAIFRFGIAIGSCKRDPAADLKGALTSVASTPHAAVTDQADVGKLLRAIDGYDRPVLRLALQLLALVFVRPGNIAQAEWSEFDEASGVWSISAAKMKMREAFRVPLSRQSLAVLAELRKITGNSKYLFPSFKKGNRGIYTHRLNAALRDIGYAADEMQAHGFRSTASTILNEHSEFSPDVIELSLAHVPGGVRGLYNRSDYWSKRCELAQWYADHLDELRNRGEVVKMPAPDKKAARRKVGA